uniref:Bridge-like lipid transfer protein family member 1 C-terminal domain-containing protein n=1 Tax=Anopheles atroparvus TaxID=41427 RepID=A0AAG5DBD8_ANOAO
MSYEVTDDPNLGSDSNDMWSMMGQFNMTQPLEDMKFDQQMLYLLASLLSSIIWMTYITFYNARLFGYILTKLANRWYVRGAYFKIGSLTVNPLAGKIMFRDVVYVCFDYTVRVQDGYFIFRWWRSYVPKDVSEDLSHSDTRLSVMLNGFEVHIYNRSDLYAKLEKTFGLKPAVLVPTEDMSAEEIAKFKEQLMNDENAQRHNAEPPAKVKKPRPEAMTATTWRDLIPVIKIDICSGRFAFGNRLTPTTLSICVEEAHCVYSTKPAVSKLDHFMHFVKAKVENAKVLLAPSPKFTGMVDEPPRYMGEGFVVMMSNLMELYFYMDEAGVVPEEPVTLTLANGDVVEAAPPVWGIDIKCGKGTDFSYGPWADRQRDHLFRFFFPPDYQPMQVTKPPKPGDRREVRSFDISLCTLNEATIDVLFSKNKETNAVHVNIGAGSYLEVTLPWIILQDGIATKVTGQLLHVEATTSLQYRSLAECETLQFNVKVHYPLKWNDHQEWTINLTGSKATACIVFSHKEFFQDLIEDWASKARPDILSFVPYTWKFGVILKEFEIITLSNEFNWIDCSSTNQENHHLAFCGDLFDLSFSLPFDDFLPLKLPIVFWIHGEGLDLSMYIPEISSSRPILLALDENARILTRDGSVKKRSELISKKWRRVCQRATGWIDCWTVPIVALSIKYIYHPMPPLGPDPQADITTPEKEEILLSPMRIPKLRKSPAIAWTTVGEGGAPRFDPTMLPPDQVSVELEIGSSVMLAYGAILRNFIHLKENIFGEDQSFTDMEHSNSKNGTRSSSPLAGGGHGKASSKDDPAKSLSETSLNPDEKPKRFDPRLYRPLEVIVSVTIHDLQAHVMKNCNENDPPCPIVLIERLGFEMKKRFHETELQVLVSPSFLISSDNTIRPSKDKHLRQGHLLLSAVQVRGHAMFSNEGRQLEDETLEYAWMLEVQLGKLSGKMTLSQLCNVVTGLETLAFLTMDSENELKSPKTVRYCHHGVPSSTCPHTKEDAKYRCPSTEDIKYRMTRVAVDAVDLYLIENGTAMHTWISPIRLATCNLHGQQVKSGITGLVPTILLRQFVSTGGHFSQYSSGNSQSNTNTTGSSRSAKLHHQNSTKHAQPPEDTYRKSSDDAGPVYRRTMEENGPMVTSTGSGSSVGVMLKSGGRRENVVGEPPYLPHRKDSKEHTKDDPYGSISSKKGRDQRDDPSVHYRGRDKEDPYASLHSARNSGRDIDSNEPWLEVGCVSLGPIIIEAASALPIPEHCLHLVQHSYLKVHDERNKKLWFLWSATSDPVRCGCVGGCAFFGSNRNGARFFKPCAQDIQEFINIARYHIHPNPREYGFGQSLLHEGQLVFHTPPYSLQPVSLQECYEYIGKPNLHRAGHRHPPAHGGGVPSACCGTLDSSKSPHLPQKHDTTVLSQKATSTEISPNNTLIRGGGNGTGGVAPGERSGKSSLERVKEKDAGSPHGSDRARGRRFSYTSGRQNTISHDVPYCRLLDASPKTTTNSSKVSTPTPGRLDSSESRLLTAKGFKGEVVDGLPPAASYDDHHQYLPTQQQPYLPHQYQHHQLYSAQHHPQQYHQMMMMEMSHSAPAPGHPLASDSEQSLGGILPGSGLRPLPSDDVIMRDVQRTVSLTSENPSEAFFSADEDLHASRSSSLKAAGGGGVGGGIDHHHHLPHSAAIPKKRFASDLSIVGPNELEGRLSTHRSDYEIHTPEHRSLPMRPQSTAELVDPQDSSESHSLSSSSFISALSSQEDITLVNLHMQINRPIVDSPLLMASYVTHLAQVRCSNWSHCSMPLGADAFSMPLFQQNEDGGLVYIGGKLIPHFDTYSNWREVKIISRYDGPSAATGGVPGSSGASTGGFSTLPKPHPWDPSVLVRSSFDKQADGKEGENEFLSSQGEIATRNSIVVRFKGQVDVMLTPLLLEGLQRMIESLTPTLSTLHPLTVVNDIHASCVRKVEAVNILKRDQSLSYWSQVHSNSKRSTAERNLQGPGGPVLTDVYEESISTQVQGLIVLPKINVTLIQSSVVEEVISFAALDNVQELSCASLLAVCFEGVSTRFHLGKTTKASMHTVYTQPTVRSGGLKKSGLIRGTRALLAHLSSQTRPDNIPGEPILLETSEKQLEELIITLDIGKAHAQLRRLKNEAANLPDSQIVITAIPAHRSRAMFDCARIPEEPSTVPPGEVGGGVGAGVGSGSSSGGLGYIMFEGGLEGVSVKIVKRSQFEKSENAEETLKPEPDTVPPATATVHSEVNQNSITLNNPLNLVTLLNEAGGNMAAEALAKFGMKKPGTPKAGAGGAKDRSSLFDIKSKEKTSSITTTTVTSTTTMASTTTTILGDGGKSFKSIIVPDEVDPATVRVSLMNDSPLPTGSAQPAGPSQGAGPSGVQGTSTSGQQQPSAAAGSGSAANGDPSATRASGSANTTGTVARCTNDNGKTSSCVIDFKTVWFNFAAPPRTPITRKIDYTRLDWNLLSTASPAITAWMNPSNRFAIKIVALMKSMYIRRTAVTVALMADAWERPTLHRPVKSRYGGKFTPLAKTLQEDPSCQLCTVLQKYVLDETAAKIENILKQQYLPQLSTMRQAVIVLSRQWKNVLYNPMLFEHQYKGKLAKPVNVTFTLPQDERYEPIWVIKMPSEPPVPSAATAVHMATSVRMGDSLNTSPSTTNNSHRKLRKKSSVKSFIPPAAPPSRASIQMFPIIFDKQQQQQHHDPVGVEYGALREGSVPSVCSSSDSLDKPWTPPANHKEDLYSWMAKQQSESTKQREKEKITQNSRPTSRNRPAIHSVKYMQDNNRILDAHLIFEPMLTCLGVMPQQMINNVTSKDVSSLESLGTNLSLVCSFDTIRIDIVVSEAGDGKKPTKQKDPKKRGNGKFTIIMPGEQPAFLCEQVGVELEVLKMTDGFPDETKPAMLYVSRGQLKKHTSTVINFSLNVRYISQQVNMPLLRLLHQITNMYQNVKDAQNELRDHPEHGGKRSAPLKDESSLASEINDPTLMGSLNEPLMAHIETSGIFDYTDERYDKFNEDISTMRHELRHSISRSKMPTLGPLIPLTPSPNSRNRPHSFAQKLRSTGKSVKGKLGYTNLNETINTPIKTSPVGLAFSDAQSKQSLEAKNSLTGGLSSTFGDYTAPFDRSTFTGPIHSILDTPKCWKTVYHLLDLYSAMPETKTIAHRVSISPDAVEQIKARKYNLLHESKTMRDDDDVLGHGGSGAAHAASGSAVKDVGIVTPERTRLVVFGVAKIHRTRLLATLSGLKLEAEITALHSSTTWRKKSRPASLECSLTGQVGRAMIVLLEGVQPNQQTVVKVSIGKSQTLYSSITRRGKDKNNGLLSIGIVNVDIPQHPVALHGMMTRSSKQISSTLQELRVTRTSSRLTRQNEEPESPLHHHHQRDSRDKTAPTSSAGSQRKHSTATVRTMTGATTNQAAGNNPSGLLQPLVMQFNIILQSLSISAALLPSLQAQYKMDHVTSTGVTGSKAKFTIDLPNHSLSFTTKIQTTETNLPSEACIALPPVHVSAEYIPESTSEEVPIDGVVLRQGGYLAASAEIGVFERCLTTDLLNHLVFVQKVFMKEVNEVVQKVYGGEKPVPLWLEEQEDNGSTIKRILFSLNIRVKRIQLTATTPCSSAVRFETGLLELHLSNRVKNIADVSNTKLFGKAQIDLNLSLGQIIKNVIFDEAEPEFQQHAFFNTTIGLRNAFQNEMLNDDKELVLITLKRPLIYVQPIAVDKAILVWLNYKNAYEYWTEKRANLNKEVLMATQQVLEKVPFGQISHHLATSANLSTLFLQLTVEDMGICLPLNQPPQIWGNRSVQDFEQKGAVVITLENTIISACSSGSLVSNGRFVGLCLRFAEDFDSSLDEWKPNMGDASIMNLCVVSEGTYEVCSRTIAAKHPDNAKWFLNVKWQMEGVDIHLDVNIGKQLSALGHTLTMLTGSEDDEPISSDTPDSDDIDAAGQQTAGKDAKSRKSVDSLPSFLFDTTLDPKKRSLLMENEINEQTKIVNDFRTLGASVKTIENEERRLQELQAVYYKYFRRDMIQKWKRPAMRKPMLKAANRSRSFVAPSPTREDLIDAGCMDGIGGPGVAGVICAVGAGTSSSVMDPFTGSDDMSSLQESPSSGPSRTASLRVKIPPNSSRVTFSETMRQSSLPSADSDVAAYSDSGLDWPRYDSSSATSDVPHLLEIDGEQVELRKKSPSHPQKQQEPNIDFELDIKVLVNSGKCVLHTKDIHDERLSSTTNQTTTATAGVGGNSNASSMAAGKHHKRERSTGGATDWGSPIPPRRNKDKSRLKYNTAPYTALVDLTIFHIPGLDVKLQYQSKTLGGDDASPRLSTADPFGVSRKLASKRATLFAWMTLQSIPEETIISPHILEFLEQTLEPIPSSKISGGVSGLNSSAVGSGTGGSGGAPGPGTGPAGAPSNPVNLQMLEHNYAAVYASFPVDVVVYFHMQPSTFRFSCLPVSRVECMLQLPSLDIIFSSNRQDDEASSNPGDTTNPSGGGGGGEGKVAGGLSVTGCLADFNVYIFHPYGGKKSNLKEAHQFSPLADSERKDSLSINVEFVKFHITRSKKINIVETAGLSRKHSDQASKATIRFSTIVDIGSASFKYDMRRLTEILAFPKAWYRRSIVRRMFLGDLGMQQTSMCDLEVPLPEGVGSATTDAGGVGESEDVGLGMGLGKGETMSRDRLRLSLESDLHKHHIGGGLGTNGGSGASSASSTARIKDQKSSSLDSTSSPSDVNQVTSWETLVLFAVNFTKLNVQMNMGNVMGNIVWLTKAFRSDGRLSIGSTGHKNMYIGVGLGGSSLDAKGGIVGGTIDLNRIDTYIHIREDPGSEPDHKVGIKLNALELKFDYMGTSVLMTRVSSLNAQLRDEWKFSKDHDFTNKLPTNYPAIILIHGDLSWDQLQMMISKSTTADILKMFYKLEEFFSQQFKSSKRVFSSLEPRLANPSLRASVRRREEKKSFGSESASASIHDARHHRHWQRPLKQTKGLWLSTLGVPLSNIGTVLGGTMELHGQNISLACFHGINFKAKSWALFSLKEPCIDFATEAQHVESTEEVHIIQTLTFGLGMNSQQPPQHHSNATVVRMSRNVIFPPQFKTLHEWFHYAFANSEIDAVDRFPVIERDKEHNTNSIERARGSGPGSASHPKLQDPNHNREVIFALPSLQLHFKTEHLQGISTPDTTQDKPMVECSFITAFEDHIFVTVDADAFFFLHDLITSYLSEKEKVLGTITTNRSSSPNPSTVTPPPPSAGLSVLKTTHAQLKSSSSNLMGPAPSMSSLGTQDSTSSQSIAIGAGGGSAVDLNELGSNATLNNGTGVGSTTSPGLQAASTVGTKVHRLVVDEVGTKKGGTTNVTSTTTPTGVPSSVTGSGSGGGSGGKHVNIVVEKADLESFMRTDWRHFNCKTWHLEPTVRLLSWAGKSIEPYGIDYILNKLGFSHARTTIPKWLQRGFMDPLDKVEALLMLQLLLMVKDNGSSEEKDSSTKDGHK